MAVMDDERPDDENPALGWPKNHRPAAPQEGLFVSDLELHRRLGVGPRPGTIAVRALEPAGFPKKDRLWGNKSVIGLRCGRFSITKFAGTTRPR